MKVQVVFQNLKKSEFIRAFVTDRVLSVLEKFPQNRRGKATVYVSMENSPRQAGPDVFGVKVMLRNSVIKTFVLSKKAGSLFQATADVAEGLLETLHRHSERILRQKRSREREWKIATHAPTALTLERSAEN